MARYWLGVAEKTYVDAAVRRGVCVFSAGRERAVEKLTPGDRLVYYAHKDRPGGAALQRFVALGTVTGTGHRQADWDGFDGWVRDAAYEADVTEVSPRPYLDRLSFVKNPQNWGYYFHAGQIEMSGDDFAMIAGAMLGGAR